MRARHLMLLPALALSSVATLAAGCGSQDGLPSGGWHPRSTGGSGTTGGTTGTGGTNGSTASSSGSGGGEGTTSGGAASSGSGSGSGGGTSSSGSSGAASSSSGSGGGASSSGSSSSGAGASSGGTGASPANAAITLDQQTLQMPLYESATVHVSVAPNGYMGSMALDAGTLPTGVTAAFAPATLTLDGTTTATSTLTLTTATNAPPGALTVAVNASADGTTKAASLAVTVQSEITLHIAQGVNNAGATVTNPDTTAFGPYPVTIVAPANLSASNPIVINFKNEDTVSHEIHADNGAQGFGHDPGPFGAGQMDPYVRKVNAAGTFDFYLHDQGSPITVGRIFISTGQ